MVEWSPQREGVWCVACPAPWIFPSLRSTMQTNFSPLWRDKATKFSAMPSSFTIKRPLFFTWPPFRYGPPMCSLSLAPSPSSSHPFVSFSLLLLFSPPSIEQTTMHRGAAGTQGQRQPARTRRRRAPACRRLHGALVSMCTALVYCFTHSQRV